MSVPEFAEGDVVAERYTIGSRVGVGPHSTTYRASDPTDYELAVKVYDAALSAGAVDALRSANDRAAAATGTAFAPIDSGVDAKSGASFIVYELCARPSLAQLAEVCPLTQLEAVALARSLARALEPVHAQGFMHLALKPSNVFVGPPPTCDVRLTDFGAPPSSPWMAPEQANGGSAGVHADVYGVALVVYFALTGRPFGDSAATLGAGWDAVFRRALSPDPDARHASLEALADAFEEAVRGEVRPPEVPPATAAVATVEASDRESTPALEPRRKSRRPTLLVAIVVFALVAAVPIAMKVIKQRSLSHASMPPPFTASSQAATASAVPSVPPVSPQATSSEAPSPSAVPVAPTVSVPSVAPSASALTADRTHGLLVVTCTPSCDSVFVDGHPASHIDQGLLLAPGVHTVGANVAHRPSKVQTILLRRGHVERLNLTF